MKKFIFLTSMALIFSYSCSKVHSEMEMNEYEGKADWDIQRLPDNDDKDKCKRDKCDEFFCHCKGLLRAELPIAPIGNALFGFFGLYNSNIAIVPFNAENNGSDGYGNHFSVCTKALKNPFGQIIANAGRINLCPTCAWVKFTFDGTALNYGPPTTLKLVPNLINSGLPEIVFGTIPPAETITIDTINLNVTHFHLYSEEVIQMCSSNGDCPPSYSFQVSTPANTIPSIEFPNAKVIAEIIGPCGCCPSER